MQLLFFLSAVLSFVATARGISVSAPTLGAMWDASKSTQTVSWDSVTTDPTSLTISLVNMATYPNTNVVLQQNVLTSAGSATVNAPSSGWPIGQGFQINLLQQNPTGVAILAQSQQFNITGSTTPFSSSASSYSRSSPSGLNTVNTGSTPSSSDTSLPSATDTAQGNTGGATGLTVQMSYIIGFALVGVLLA